MSENLEANPFVRDMRRRWRRFNRASARNVLLSVHRWRVPLFGISAAYVRAGALAAVYSTPRQIGRQLAEALAAIAPDGPIELPAPRYPKYFELGVNYRVAEALGLAVADEAALQRALRTAPEEER